MNDPQQSPSDPVPSLDLSGRTLGDYQILRRLGRGGMAEVYLAEQHSLQRKVAFKVLKKDLAGDDSYVRRFHHEAQAAASLTHPNIVQIFEVGLIDDIHYIAQEYVAGQNLKQFLRRHGSLEAPLAAHIIRQIAAALHKASQEGIIHRDIKPENIMLASSGEVKVADFGLARYNNKKTMELTQVGVTMGTPLYMSPEQIEGRKLDHRSDIYSLGATCYEMLSGRPPFEGDNPLSLAVQHLKNDPERLESLRTDLPAPLCRIVHKMLAKEPDGRYPSAADLLQEMRTLEIEGLDEIWAEHAHDWFAIDLSETDASRGQATQQLAAVMQTQAMQIQRKTRTRRFVFAGMCAAFLLGAGIAWLSHESILQPEEVPPVRQMESVEAQFFHASFLRSEEGWRSVWDYFPGEDNVLNLRFERMAKERLADQYLDNAQWEQAFELYQILSNVEEVEPGFRAAGFVGLANVYTQRGEVEEAQKILATTWDIIKSLSSEDKKRYYQKLHRQLRDVMDEGLPDAQLDRLRKELEEEDPPNRNG